MGVNGEDNKSALEAELASVERWACCMEPERRVRAEHKLRQVEALLEEARVAFQKNLAKAGYKDEVVMAEVLERILEFQRNFNGLES